MIQENQEQARELAAKLKRDRIEEVFLSHAIRDAVTTRGGRRVYVDQATSRQRSDMGNALRSELSRISKDYTQEVGETDHIKNINDLKIKVETDCGPSLNGERLKFGVAQKALNSYLKYLWCNGNAVKPPHCPFDNKIIKEFESDLDPGCNRRWTDSDEADYKAWVVAARKTKGERECLPEWELRVW